MAKSLVGNLVLVKWIGIAGVGIAVFLAMLAVVGDAQGPVMRYWQRYCAFLERKLRLMFIWTPGWYVAMGQLVSGFAVIALHLAVGLEAWWLMLFLVVVGPPYYIERMRRKRVELIESQLDSFLTALANALKAVPSIGNAFISIQPLLPPPIQTEVELACKEMRVGSTLDQALLNMGGRVGSRQLDSALSSILIGRQVGGDMPRILETTAQTMREMARLEGVVQTKTAEGKAQLWVLAVVPFTLTAILNWMQPGFFEPLQDSFIGWIICVIAGICWLASLLVARKVLAVDV
jgi:tight adherence protein B